MPTLSKLRVLDYLNTHVVLFGFDSASGMLTVEYTNAAMIRMLGDKSEAALNSRMTARLAPKTAQQTEQIRTFAARHLHDGRTVDRARHTWTRADGSSIQMIVTCRAVTIDGGTAGPRNCIMVQTSAMLPVRKFAMDSIDNWNNKGLEDSFANELRRVAVESSPETMFFGTQGEVLYVNPAAREWFQGVVGDKPEAEWRMKDMFASRATYLPPPRPPHPLLSSSLITSWPSHVCLKTVASIAAPLLPAHALSPRLVVTGFTGTGTCGWPRRASASVGRWRCRSRCRTIRTTLSSSRPRMHWTFRPATTPSC